MNSTPVQSPSRPTVFKPGKRTVRFESRRCVIEPIHPSEAGAAAGPASTRTETSLAALLTRHVLRDGELVLLILKPSLWFVLLNSMRFSAGVLILLIAAKLWLPWHTFHAMETGIFVIAGRVMWSLLQWMGRLYVLTDMRIVRLSGVFTAEIFDCPLRKVGQVKLISTFREKLLRLGSIEILPMDETCAAGDWRTIRRPAKVLEMVQATIQRAKQGGPPCALR